MITKSVLVLLCAGLLAAVFANRDIEPSRAFRSGHEYSYDYNGQVASSLSNGDQYSVSRFRSLVKLNFVTDQLVTVQLEQPQMGQWNEYFDQPYEFHKFDKFEPVQIESNHVEKLNLPFQIRFTNGKVSDLTFHKDDVTFSENIKRAIVNTLQVQLENSEESQNVEERENKSYAFSLNETTIEGECESLYTVVQVSSETETIDSYNVTKSIDFSQCRNRPEFRYNYFRFAEPIELVRNLDDKTAKKYIHSNPALGISSVYEFALNGDRRQFIIKESKISSKYSYEMMDGERVHMITYALAKLTLKNVERKEASEQMTSVKSSASLMYSNALDVLRERFIAEGDESYLRQNPYMRMPNAVSIVTNIMKRLLETSTQKTIEGIDEQATRYLTQLISILRLSTRSDIQTIHKNLFESDGYNGIEKTFMQSILADALAIAGTKNTLDHLFDKIQKGDISTTKAATTLSKLMNLRIVSTATVKSLNNLCQTPRVQESTILKRTCMLTYGAMVNAMCSVDSPFKHGDKYTTASMNKYCEAGTKKDIAKDIIDYYKKASTRADKILAVKTMGNMGLENTVIFLEEIIRDWNVEKIIRIQAIDALRHLRVEMSRRVQRILLPIFQDRREHPEIRMNAVYQLLHTRPDQSVLDFIMLEMIREPNTHVKNFVNQLVHQMIKNSDKVWDRETAQTLKSMLKHFNLYNNDQDKTNFATSKFFSTVVAVDQWQFQELASQFDFAALFSNDSRLPKELMASWSLLSNKRIIPNTYQVGMHTQDLEQLLERLYQSWESKNFDDLMVRDRRSVIDEYNPMNFLKNIYNRLKIATRRVSTETANPMILLYSRWQNMDTIFCLTDEDSLPQLLQSFIVDGKVDVSNWELKNMKFNWASASYGYEQQIKTPTICGIPLLTTIRIPTIAVIDGSISTSFNEKENEDRLKNARIHLKVEPKIATTVIVKMEMFSPLFTSGVKTFHSAQLRLPLNMVAKVKAPHWLPEIELHMPTEEVRLIHLQTRPVTFYRVWPEKSGVFIEAAEKTLIIDDVTGPLHQKRINHVDAFLGMNINIDAHWHASPLSVSQKLLGDWLLSGENAFEFKIQPTADSAKSLKLTVNGHMKVTKDVRDVDLPDFQTLFGIHNNQMFANTERDEQKLIKEQVQRAAGKLDHLSHFSIKAEAVKGVRPHTAKITLNSVCDKDMILCVINHEMDVDSKWTFKSIAHLAMPELRGVVSGFSTRHIIAKVDAGFGGSDKNQIIVNFYGRPSAEKIESLKLLLNDRENVRSNSMVYENAPQILKPNDYIMIFENKLSTQWTRHMHTFYNYLSFASFVSMPERELIEKETSKRSQTLMTRLTLDENNYNMTISMPNKQHQLELDLDDVLVPRRGNGESKARSIYDVLRRSSNDDAECSIKKGQMVRTFDGKTFKLPLNMCYTILAKDCVEDSTFVVMAKKSVAYLDELKLKMVNQEKIYEITKHTNKLVVKVNNYLVDEVDYEQYGIYKVGGRDEIVEIRCPKTGITVRFDGLNVKITIGSQYLNRQCGICGHYNGDVTDDLRKPDNEEATSLRDFHQSYLYRDAECDPTAVEQVKKDSSEEKQNEEYSMDVEEENDVTNDQENKENLEKTLVVEYRNRICFSKNPVKCPEGSQKEGRKENKDIDFICMKRSQNKTKKFLRLVNKGETIEVDEAMGNQESIPQNLSIKCVVNNTSSSRRRGTTGNDDQEMKYL